MRNTGKILYHLKTIHSREEIENCEKAAIGEAQWNCTVKPEAWAYMGYLPGEGLLVRLVCREKNPKRTYVNHKESVWKDSAMEVFLAFSWRENGEPGKLTNESLYLNFEINANGALYAQWGFGKKNRDFVPERVYEESGCRAQISDDCWQAELLVPEWYLREFCGWEPRMVSRTENPVRMFCNFYKISESPEIEHYLSYSRIENETPNFHLPVFFAEVAAEE